jgi:hypothetical protein
MVGGKADLGSLCGQLIINRWWESTPSFLKEKNVLLEKAQGMNRQPGNETETRITIACLLISFSSPTKPIPPPLLIVASHAGN